MRWAVVMVASVTILLIAIAGRVASAVAVPYSSVIQASGTQLFLYGSAYRFTGVDAYEAATQWGTNAGCGPELSNQQLDQLFASLPSGSVVRFWTFQGSLATNVNTGQLDWGPIDRVFDTAARYGVRLIPVITSQSGSCDGDHWKDPSWYEGGFMHIFNDPPSTDGRGLTPLSYWTYLQDIVTRYASSPALGMWEPVSEAEASTCPPRDEPLNCSGHQICSDEAAAAGALRYFFDTVGAEIHELDPRHLVESGLLGGGQCGTEGADYAFVSASPGIDVLSYHDYWGVVPIGGDRWNGLAVRLAQARTLTKPIIAGEVGLTAGVAPGCMSDAARNAALVAKRQSQIRAGSSGFLVWDWVPSTSSRCGFDVTPSDPLLGAGGEVG
jgi:mannan endo-1,4-beta-mannosidase